MGSLRPLERLTEPAVTIGLVGGAISIPPSVVYYLVLGPPDFPEGIVILVGLAAGFVAERRGSNAKLAGLVAGLVGSTPGIRQFLPAVFDLVGEWVAGGGVVSPIVVMLLALVFVVGIPALFGHVGGAVGGWLANVFGPDGGVSPQ